MQTLTIQVDDDVLTATKMSVKELGNSMLATFAAFLFKARKLTLAQAAHFCKMNIYDFMAYLKQHDIPVLNYPPADLKQELAELKDEHAHHL
jgi:predicted HTH domain antitoxin